MILDALMPSAPVVVANPGMPPGGLLEAADAVRQLEQLKKAGYISSNEYTKERQAIEKAMQPSKPVATPSAMKALPASPVKKSAMTGPSGSGPAVHLASYRTRKNADKGWGQIRRAHKSLLGGLDHQVTRVNLDKKGTYYRLKAGPLKSAAAAKDMCRKLKRRRQFCEPSVMKGG